MAVDKALHEKLTEKAFGSWAWLADVSKKIESLENTLERDRSAVAEGIQAIRDAIKRREWLRLGRGSYEWDDERWKDEFGSAIDEIFAALKPLRKVAADWSDCPTDAERILKARAEAEQTTADLPLSRIFPIPDGDVSIQRLAVLLQVIEEMDAIERGAAIGYLTARWSESQSSGRRR